MMFIYQSNSLLLQNMNTKKEKLKDNVKKQER